MRTLARKRFKVIDNYWSSTICDHSNHRIKINGIKYEFNGYYFYNHDIPYGIVIGERGRYIFEVGDELVLISEVANEIDMNYMGYCKKKNYYLTFDENQIEFL